VQTPDHLRGSEWAGPSQGEGGAELGRAGGSSVHSGQWATVSGGGAWGRLDGGDQYEFFNSSVTSVRRMHQAYICWCPLPSLV
jgi:hypothetical protein